MRNLLFFILLSLTAFTSCQKQADLGPQKPRVLVSIAPLQFFVENIAGDTVDVQVLVPAGGNPHAFEPTPKQMMSASQADLWLRIGEPFEKRSIEVLQNHNKGMVFVDTREGIELIGHEGHHCCCHDTTTQEDGQDTHVWLSPKEAKIQVINIAYALIKRYPMHKDLYEANLKRLTIELNQLDQLITSLFKPLQERTFLVSHPAFGYLARDYGLTQLSVEFEGKDPSPQQLTQLLEKSRQLKIRKVFTQQQYQNKGAILIAKELNAAVYEVDPYAKDYLNNLRHLAELIANPSAK